MNEDFILAIGELGKEKGIGPELLFQAVEEALVTAYKKNFNSLTNSVNFFLASPNNMAVFGR